MGLSRTVSDIDCDFSQKSPICFHPRVFYAPADGLLLELAQGMKN